jgi:RNA polymerase sigma-70 factor, ECF subfamily
VAAVLDWLFIAFSFSSKRNARNFRAFRLSFIVTIARIKLVHHLTQQNSSALALHLFNAQGAAKKYQAKKVFVDARAAFEAKRLQAGKCAGFALLAQQGFSGAQVLFILALQNFSAKEKFLEMYEPGMESITQLLIEVTNRNSAAVDALLPLIYDELRSLAANYLRRERPDHTLQPTALVHEAYLRMVDQTQVNWQNRAHFFGVAAQMMRRILVDHARAHTAEKRGADFQKLSLDENIDKTVERSSELIALDDALKTLARMDEQKGRIVELRFFGGLSIDETAEVLGVSAPTVKRQWRMAKAWLYGQVQGQ